MRSARHFSAIQFIGTQRSGSNLLRVMLNQLPEISAPHPPHILRTFFPLLPLYGDINTDQNFFLLTRDVCNWVNINPVPWENVHLDPEQIISKCRSKSLVEIFRVIYETKAEKENARYWCCKSMESVYYLDEIESADLFPTYIHLYRDGRDVSLSFLKAIVGPKHIYQLANKWRNEQELCLQLKERIPQERFISVKYEELISEPRKILLTICDRLGVSFGESMLDYFHSRESLITARSGAMWKNLLKPIMKENHDKFLTGLSMEQIQIFEFVAGKMLRELGYSCVGSDPHFSIGESDIAMFEQENIERIKRSLQQANQEDINRRQQQEALLLQIKSRVL